MIPEKDHRFIINVKTREITIPDDFSFLGILNDHNSKTACFEIDRYCDDVDLSTKTCVIQYSNNNQQGGFYAVTSFDTKSVPNKIIFEWEIQDEVTAVVGNVEFSVRFYSTMELEDKIVFSYNFNTEVAILPVKNGLNIVEENVRIDSYEVQGLTQKFIGLLQEAREVQDRVESIDIVTTEAIDAANTAVAKAKEVSENTSVVVASATSAKKSEEIALNSKTASSLSENNAKASETASKRSETNAKASEKEAKSSAQKASQSEINAKASEQNAATSAESAKNSAAQALAVVTPADKTLSKDGIAADAKTVGEKFSNYYTKTESDAKFCTANNLPKASNTTYGAIKIGSNLTISDDGTLSVPDFIQYGTTAPTELAEGVIYIQYSV